MTKEQKKVKDSEPREVGATLPFPLPDDAGDITQVAYAPNATPDWQDVVVLTDGVRNPGGTAKGRLYHGWYRIGAGWNGPERVF